MDADLLPFKKALLNNLSHLDALHQHWDSGDFRHTSKIELRYLPKAGPYLPDYLATLQRFVRQFRFELPDIQYLGNLRSAAGQPRFPESFINYLQRMPFEFEWTVPHPDIETVHSGQYVMTLEGPTLPLQWLTPALVALLEERM